MSERKLTAVGRLLESDHADRTVALPITREQYLDPTFITRLSFRHADRKATNVSALIASLVDHSGHALFIDTNLTWLAHGWWDELLSEPGRVHLPGRVVREPVTYLQRHKSSAPRAMSRPVA